MIPAFFNFQILVHKLLYKLEMVLVLLNMLLQQVQQMLILAM
ncbi:Protein of unknown function [Gryllus bimaculatus]|nr:Protein of unknown function [Gryllus bimaculatus]